MELTRLSVKRPLTMLMIILALAVLGWRGFTLMKVDRFPPVDFPIVSVVVTYPGASPQDVEEQVVKPVEDAVAGIPGVDYIQSVSNESFGFVVIAFLDGVDGNQAAIDVDRQVSAIKGALPDDASEPSVVKADFNAIPIMNVILTGPQSQDELFKIATDQIKPNLQSTLGVASVSVAGGRDRIIAVKLDAHKLTAFNLPISLIDQTFAINNLTFPIGSLEEGRLKSSIRSVGSFQSLAEVENMVLSGGSNPRGGGGGGRSAPAGSDEGGLVYVRDVADVVDTFADSTVFQRYNGQDTVVISVIKATDANVIEVADDVRHRLDSLNDTLPGGAQITIVSDDSEFIKNSVGAVEEDLLLAILVTGLVMLAFLHTIRSTFIVIMAIPTSLLSTFLVMWALGYTLNVLTLLALTLIIGILVDDSIVVLENIERHLKMRKKPTQAAIDGRAEIGWAAIAITLVDVVVYVPVAFTSGIIGQFFRSYGITIAVATLFSLFVSFTLTPLMAAYLLKDESEPETRRTGIAGLLGKLFRPIGWVWDKFTAVWERGFDMAANLYARVIRLSLHNAWTQLLVLVIAFALLAGSVLLIPGIGFEFMPQEDDGQFTVNIEMPPSTRLEVTDGVARQIEQIVLQEVPETVSVLTRVGSAGGASLFSGGGSGPNAGSVFVQVVNKNDRVRGITDIVNDLRPVVAVIPDATISVNTTSFVGGMESGVSLQVYGPDPNVLIDLANQVEEIVRTTPGTIDVVNKDAVRSPETKITLDRQRLSDLGLSAAQVSLALRTAVSGNDVGDYAPDGEEKISLILRMDETSRQDLQQLLQLPIGFLGGKPIVLGQVAQIERTLTPSVINRYNRQRILTVSAGVTSANAGGVANDVEARLNSQMNFPPEYGYRFSGATEQQRESFAQLGSAILLSILLIYMLLVALYQDLLQPLSIMFTLPMALVGIIAGLAITDNTLNIFSILGIIMLFGIVTRNAILIIDFANQLQETGNSRKEALIEAGRLRLRPIAMTANTLIFALLPVLLSTADGSESRQPLAAVLVGGAITAGMMALLVTPVLYNILEAFGDWVKSVFRWLAGSAKPAAPKDQPSET